MNTGTKHQHGRRQAPRHVIDSNITVSYRGEGGTYVSLKGRTTTISHTGLSCELEAPIPASAKYVQLTLEFSSGSIPQAGHIVWLTPDRQTCGIKFQGPLESWPSAFAEAAQLARAPQTIERRLTQRRTVENDIPDDRRLESRRFSDFLGEITEIEDEIKDQKVKAFLRSKSTSHTEETIKARRQWIAEVTGTSLKHIATFSEEYDDFVGKIENPIGVAHIPLGIAGPLRINGDHAKGTFFIPLATTEGALVTSYTLGSRIITRSGGAHVKVDKDELRVAPFFAFNSQRECVAFVTWVHRNFAKIKSIAESTSKHLKLTHITDVKNGRRVILNFHYNTADAMGMNMACKATEFACQFISSTVKPEEYWLRSNFNANKKVTANNFINGYGKKVTADVTIPRRVIAMLNTTPEKMEKYFARTLLADAHAVQIGANGHYANAIAAMYIACGQDVASVANSHVGISTCEVTAKGDLYFSAYLSNVLVGTVGGGTQFGTAAECLKMLDCVGSGKSKKFAEIVAAVALAGEIGICASIVNETYVFAHETFGRNRPKE